MNKVVSVRVVRCLTGAGLRESLNLVEAYLAACERVICEPDADAAYLEIGQVLRLPDEAALNGLFAQTLNSLLTWAIPETDGDAKLIKKLAVRAMLLHLYGCRKTDPLP